MALIKQQIPYEFLARWGTDVTAELNSDTGKYELVSGHVGQHVKYANVIFDDETGTIESIKPGKAAPVKAVVDGGIGFPLGDVLSEVQQKALADVEAEKLRTRSVEAEREALKRERDSLKTERDKLKAAQPARATGRR
jgi:hypothetical protein